MTIHPHPFGPRRLVLTAVVAAASMAAALGLATDPAGADYTARVQAGTLELTGDGAGGNSNQESTNTVNI